MPERELPEVIQVTLSRLSGYEDPMPWEAQAFADEEFSESVVEYSPAEALRRLADRIELWR